MPAHLRVHEVAARVASLLEPCGVRQARRIVLRLRPDRFHQRSIFVHRDISEAQPGQECHDCDPRPVEFVPGRGPCTTGIFLAYCPEASLAANAMAKLSGPGSSSSLRPSRLRKSARKQDCGPKAGLLSRWHMIAVQVLAIIHSASEAYEIDLTCAAITCAREVPRYPCLCMALPGTVI